MFPRKKLLESLLVSDLNRKNGVKLGSEACQIIFYPRFTALNNVYSFWCNDLHALTMPLMCTNINKYAYMFEIFV